MDIDSDWFAKKVIFIGTENLKESAVIFPVSRICVHPERFSDDRQEVMSNPGKREIKVWGIYTNQVEGDKYLVGKSNDIISKYTL